MIDGFTRTTAWLLGLTALTAAIAATGPLHDLARSIYPTAPHAPTDPPGVLELLAHNAAIAAIPGLLVLVKWRSHSRWRRAGDVLIPTLLAVQAIAIGLGIGSWPSVLAHLPHLPLELAALAAGAQIWTDADEREKTGRWAAITGALLVAAAFIETGAAP